MNSVETKEGFAFEVDWSDQCPSGHSKGPQKPTTNTSEDKVSSSQEVVEFSLDNESDRFLAGHKVGGRVLIPGSAFILTVWKAYAKAQGGSFDSFPVTIKRINFHRAIALHSGIKIKLNVKIIGNDFKILDANLNTVCSGVITKIEEVHALPIKISSSSSLNADKIYEVLSKQGFDYDGRFKGIKSVDSEDKWAELLWSNNWISFIDTLIQFYAVTKGHRVTTLPTAVQSISIDPGKLFNFLEHNKTVPAMYHECLDIIHTHGIQLQAITLTPTTRRPEPVIEPYVEKSVFTPFSNEEGLNGDKITQFFAHVVLENYKPQKSPLTIFDSAIPLTPLVVAIESHPDVSNGLQISKITDKQKTTTDKYDLATIDRLPLPTPVVDAIKPNAFLVYADGGKMHVDNDNTIKNCGFTLVSHKVADKHYYLYQKTKEQAQVKWTNVVVDESDWLNGLKSLEQNTHVRLIDTDTESTERLKSVQNQYPNLHISYYKSRDRITSKEFEAKMKEVTPLNLTTNVLQEGKWGTYCHYPLKYKDLQSTQKCHNAYIDVSQDLSSYQWIQKLPCRSPTDPALLSFDMMKPVDVHYTSLNRKDYLKATGKLASALTSDENVLGMEYSGVNTKGQRVMGIVPHGALATTVEPSVFTWALLDEWTLAEGASIPLAYTTALYAMSLRGRLKDDECLLIHCGNTDIGQAALHNALDKFCQVYTTADSAEKKAFLHRIFPELEDHEVINTQELNFEEVVMNLTKGVGVDMVVNLENKDKSASLRCLSYNGRFVDIDPKDNVYDDVSQKNVAIHRIQFENFMSSWTSAELLKVGNLMINGILQGFVKPIYYKVFAIEEIGKALRLVGEGDPGDNKVLIRMQTRIDGVERDILLDDACLQGEEAAEKNKEMIEKVELGRVRAVPTTCFDYEKQYLVVSRLDDFDFEFIRWLTTRGAKHITVVTDLRETNGWQERCKRKLESREKIYTPHQIKWEKVQNLDDFEKLQSLLQDRAKSKEIGGIFNLLKEQTEITNKIASHLDTLSKKWTRNLDYFVVFSKRFGRNKDAADPFMERLCERRQAYSLPAHCIQWGPEETDGGKFKSQSVSSRLRTLDLLLLQKWIPVLSSFVKEA